MTKRVMALLLSAVLFSNISAYASPTKTVPNNNSKSVSKVTINKAPKDVVYGFQNPEYYFELGDTAELANQTIVIKIDGKKELVNVSWQLKLPKNIGSKLGRYKISGLIDKYGETETAYLNYVNKGALKMDKGSQYRSISIEPTKAYDLTDSVSLINRANEWSTFEVTWISKAVKGNKIDVDKNIEVIGLIDELHALIYVDFKVVDINKIIDPVLREQVVNRNPYSYEPITELKTLRIKPKGVKTLDGMEMFEYLETLYIDGDGMKLSSLEQEFDSKAIGKLKSLKTVELFSLTQESVNRFIRGTNLEGKVLQISNEWSASYDSIESLKECNASEIIMDWLSINNLQCIREAYQAGVNFKSSTLVTDLASLQKLETERANQKASQIAYQKEIDDLKEAEQVRNSEFDQLVDDFINRHISSGMSDLEKIKAIHDGIINQTAYATVERLEGSNTDIYSAYGVLKHGRGVCQGYADAFDKIAKKVGLKSIMVHGTADNGSGNGYNGHAWNLVKVDGQFKHIDLTWDDPIYTYNGVLTDMLRYDYYLITDEMMRRDHIWNQIDYTQFD